MGFYTILGMSSVHEQWKGKTNKQNYKRNPLGGQKMSNVGWEKKMEMMILRGVVLDLRDDTKVNLANKTNQNWTNQIKPGMISLWEFLVG